MAHLSVLKEEVLAHLTPIQPQRMIDGTLGAGGHAHALLSAGAGELLGLDQDAQALALAQQTLAPFAGRVHYAQTNYEYMTQAAAQIGWQHVDAILLDIGVSSMQLDQAERGFSFMQDGPLDMRMDNSQGQSAADLVNTWDAAELTDIFFRYGEEKFSRRLAQVIVQHRPYERTQQLAQVIEAHKPAQWKEKIHPATRIFQALRIAVNDELGVLERTLPRAIELLRVGGRLAVITFHSLEDRIVKQAFKAAASDCICPPEQPICTCDKVQTVQLVTRKPLTASAAEIAQNPRSRSAKLRVVERV